MMLTRNNGTTIRNIPRVDPSVRQPSRVAVTVTRLDGSSRIALSIGSDTTNLVRSYDIPLRQFLQLVAAVVTPDDLAHAGIAPEQQVGHQQDRVQAGELADPYTMARVRPRLEHAVIA